ncbi:hypothetical protein M422DRAFT_34365 [Sphaerobolus stellatus SS14]|uniref:Uncharacterized protein n=1 Tax=Sphaerobolus stellatus (strain SS14) TaxID=990650 RepID=A0A0C9VF42_SPHS4|nr:hypothetical protein M422DRAFT_34365 [Sphaerobolus stellatus SS14]
MSILASTTGFRTKYESFSSAWYPSVSITFAAWWAISLIEWHIRYEAKDGGCSAIYVSHFGQFPHFDVQIVLRNAYRIDP